ncbi:hypothetical protein [Lysobacter sp. A289]
MIEATARARLWPAPDPVVQPRLQDDATIVIHDPGHGMSPEQISAIYG